MLPYREDISIAQLVIFFPTMFLSVWLIFSQGLRRSAGWAFLVVFALIRIVGAITQIISESHPSVGIFTTTIICSTIGLSPLLLCVTGLLSRVNRSICRITESTVTTLILRLLQIPITVALVLGIVGGVRSSDSDKIGSGSFQINSLTKAGIVIFTAVYVAIVILTILIAQRANSAAPGEKRIVLAVALALPFLLVRLVWSLLAAFSHIHDFSYITPNDTVLLVMNVIMEFIVVLIFLVMGVTLNREPAEEEVVVVVDDDTRQKRAAGPNDDQFSHGPLPPSGRRGGRKFHGGPIMMLVQYVMEKKDKHNASKA